MDGELFNDQLDPLSTKSMRRRILHAPRQISPFVLLLQLVDFILVVYRLLLSSIPQHRFLKEHQGCKTLVQQNYSRKSATHLVFRDAASAGALRVSNFSTISPFLVSTKFFL
jgi:hypothetical protein